MIPSYYMCKSKPKPALWHKTAQISCYILRQTHSSHTSLSGMKLYMNTSNTMKHIFENVFTVPYSFLVHTLWPP